MTAFTIRPLERSDREWVAHFLDERWGTTQIVSRGKAVYGHLLPGFMAERGGAAAEEDVAKEDVSEEDTQAENIGLITVHIGENECEITTLDSLDELMGVGSALVEAVENWAREAGIKRLWLVTTNDNLEALKFWQKRGYELVSVHRNAIAEARRIKPQIPITGLNGITIRDEIELEKLM
ncbi:MAG: GNAT family N-acetyltransferase [Chloroflexi bacterium]|nr:GNAT family N-acetyltransferase [Chloroflexota bacterium]